MKKITFLCLCSLSVSLLFAQWTTSGNDIYNSNSGKVGIGTTTPSNLLHLIYSSSQTSATTGAYFVTNQSATNTGTVTSLGSSFKSTHSTGDVAQAIAINGVCENNGTGNVNSLKGIQGTGYLSGSGTALNAYGVYGGVSITGSGTVTNGYGLYGTVSISGSGAVTNGYGVYVPNFSSAVTNKWGVYVADANAKSYFSGNVMIGTTDPQGYKLAVNGDAIFTKVKVKAYANWPDYVFHHTYKLRPLVELEKYIQQYKHLPEVPSANEIEKNGLDIGENQGVLLKKIEELTLYIIDQQKQIDELKKELRSIKK